MKKLLLVAILMLALVFTVVACNNNEPADTTAGETTVGQVPGTAEPAPETEAPETPTEAPTETPTETPTEAPEVPTEPETTVDDTPATQAPVDTTEPETEAPVDPAAPVLKVEPDALASAATGNTASGIAGAEVMTEGGRTFVRLTASNGDPFFVAVSNAGAMPDYVAISYRTNSATDGEFFVGSGASATGQGDNFQYVWNEGAWNLAIINLAETGVTTITDGVIGYLRLDCFAGNSAAGDYFDVEYVAFFNSAEYAQAYDFEMHKAPMWDADKSVVTHQSFDELDKYAGANKVGAVFNPGASSGWDKIVTLPDFSVDTLRYWGWIGAKGELGQFGYQINGGSAIYDDAWTHATEQPVIDAAAATGATCASRMQIMISLAGLDGENTVRVLYKTADGIEVCLNEFTVILPEKPKDIKDTFISDVASNADGTDLQASDLANFFTIKYGAADPHAVIGGQYCYGGINEMFANVNGKYAYTVNMQEAANTAMMFVRGTHVVHSVDLPAVEGNLYPINNYYETDGLGRMGGAGIYAAIYGGKLNLMIKAYDDAGKVHIANKEYAIEAEGTELTMADDGETVYIMVNGKLMATIALSGSTSYDKICDLAEGVTFAQTAVVTLADGTTDTIENTLVVSTCASQIGIALRPAAMKFDSVKVQAFSAVNVPEFEKPEEPRENIALNKPVSSDNIENEANIPSNATDGDEVTRFGALPTGEVKLVVDLEGVYALDDMKVLFENASCEYEIAVSVDGVNYTTIYTDANHGAATKNIQDLGGINARYILFHRLPTAADGHFWFSIYELYVYGEKVAEPEIPEVPSNEIKVSTTDTYTWIDVVEFTATATGNYTFTLPAGLGAWDVYACDNWAGDPYVDYYANENGAKFTIGLTEGATTTFYVAATTKADWTITWEYTEGEVEPDETEPSDLTTIEPVIGENTVTITDADMNEGAVMGTLTVDKAGQYSIVAADFMGVFYIDGIQQRGSAWLEPGTYDIALVIFAFGPGTYNYTLTVEYPPVPGEEDLPFEWDGDVTFEGAHDVWYTYTAEQDGILVITYPEGNWISGIANKTDAAYSVVVSEGETVKFNVFGNNAGTYSIKMVKFVHASKDELRVLDANGNQIGQAFAPGQCNAWSGVLFLEEGSFGSLVNWGWTALVGETFEYCVEINGELYYGDFYFEPEQGVLDAIAASGATTGSRYYVTIPADALDLGGNLIKVGVSIDGQAIHYFWEYTVVVNPAEETETNVPEVTEPAPEVTEPSEPETDAPVVPDEPETPAEPETPVEPEKPELPTYTAWDADKAIVKHQSFDELYYGTDRSGIFTPGQSANWNKIAALNPSITSLNYWGWIGYVGEFGTFGYQIDANEAVFSETFAVEAGADVIAAAQNVGATGASRMLININFEGLSAGAYTVNVLYKTADGNVVALCTFIATVADAEGNVPDADPTAIYTAEDLAAMNATNAVVSSGEGYAHFVTGGEIGDKTNPSIALTSEEGFSDIIVIKYRTNCANYGSNYWGILNLNETGTFIGNRKGSDNWFKYEMNGEWTVLILDMRKNKASNDGTPNVDVTDGAAITSIVYDFFDYAGNSGKGNSSDGEAEYFDIAYIAFFETKAEAVSYAY